MKDWDTYGRDSAAKTPAILSESTTSNKFLYKTCQPSWKISDANNGTGTTYTACNSEGHAYYAEAGACKYSFKSPELTELFDATGDDDGKIPDAEGVELSYESNQDCANKAGEKAFFNITLICDRDT